MKRHESKYNPAVKELSDYIHKHANDGNIRPDVLGRITRVLDGVEVTDNLLVQKDTELQSKENLLVQKDHVILQKDSVINEKTLEVQSKDNLLVQKEQKLQETITDRVQKEFADVIHKLQPDLHYGTAEDFQVYIQGKLMIESKNYALMQNDLPFYKEKLLIKEFTEVLNKLHPDEYPTKNPNDWKGDYGKQTIESKNYALMQNDLPFFKQDLLRREFIDVLHKLYPSEYPTKNTDEWKDSWGKRVIDSKNYEVIEDKLPTFKKLLLSQIENVLNSKDQLLVVKDNETESLRNLLLQKEAETEELLAQKELEKKELLVQKEVELANKSFVKNQVIGELQEDIGLKEKETLNLKIESLMKQLEFKDKALEDAHEIVKQNKMINELQEKLLAFQNLSKHDETLKLELSVIHFKVEESILNGNLDEMKELSKYLSELMKNPIEKDESLEISELLNLSPIGHVEANLVQNPVPVINNFVDINHINTTHSVYPSGEGSESFEII